MKKRINTDEAAKLIGISSQTLRKWRIDPKRDQPRYHKVGFLVWYDRQVVMDWIAKTAVGT